MLTRNTNKVVALIKELNESIPSEYAGKVVIFGSSAITLHDIDLGREVDDLDVFVSVETYTNMKGNFTFQEQQKNGIGYLTITNKPKIELWSTFPGVTFEDIFESASISNKSSGLLVASMQDLCKWKQSQGRDKDLQDIKLMGC